MAAIGRVLLIPKGTYDGSTTYNMLDWVRYDGRAWVCKVDGTVGVTPTEGANWTLLAQDGSVSGSVAWVSITGKPFDDVDSTDFDVSNIGGSDIVSIKRGTFGTVRVSSGGTTTDLEANGDSVFKINAGTNVTISADDTSNPKEITINSSGGGGGSSTWGSITGTLSDQTDLQNALNAKAASTDIKNASLYIQQNGVSAYGTGQSFDANASTAATANIITDDWAATATVSSGSITFSSINDSGNYGYEVFIQVTSSSTNKNPSAQLSTVSGEGTSSMSLTYTTDADNGATAKLRRIK